MLRRTSYSGEEAEPNIQECLLFKRASSIIQETKTC